MKNSLCLFLVGLAARVTAQGGLPNKKIIDIPGPPQMPETPRHLTILPLQTAGLEAKPTAPNLNGNMTACPPPPTSTINNNTAPLPGANSTMATTPQTKTGPNTEPYNTASHSQGSNPAAAAPTVANYVAGMVGLAGLVLAI